MTEKYFYFIFFIILLTGGLFGLNFWYLLIISIILALLVFYIIASQNNFVIPPNFKFYFLFLGFILISFFWSVNLFESLKLFLLFLSGGFCYLLFANKVLKTDIRYLSQLIFALGVVLGLILSFQLLTGRLVMGAPGSLTGYASGFKNHHQIGLIWVLIILSTIYRLNKKPINGLQNLSTFIIVPVGIAFLMFSQSRSALISVLIGLFFLYFNFLKAFKKSIFYLIITVFLITFIAIGAEKSIFLSRPYFIQSLIGFLYHPFGVGVGNFAFISKEIGNKYSFVFSFSSSTHNLILEMLSGMGIFTLIFAYWLVKEIKNVLSSNLTIYGLVLVALIVNFMFDYTYLVPTYLWLFFITIGLNYKNHKLT